MPLSRRFRAAPYDASWRERLLVFGIAALVLASTLIAGLGLWKDGGRAAELAGLIPASALVVGKFLPLWSVSGQSSFSPWELGLVIWVMDTATVIVMAYAIEGLERIRWLERLLARLHTNARLVIAAYPRIRKAAVMGVMLFVLFPVAGTGALGGSFLGILLGLHRWVLIAAVSGGGLLGGMAMAYAAVHFGDAMGNLWAAQNAPAVRYAIIGGIALAFVTCIALFNRAYRRALAEAARRDADT